MCGSFGSRHWGQLTSVGAVVFHCDLRDLVLLLDILRFGTATSALLSLLGACAVLYVSQRLVHNLIAAALRRARSRL